LTPESYEQNNGRTYELRYCSSYQLFRDADLILGMDQGEFVEQGNHEELLIKVDSMKKLYNSQFKQAARIKDYYREEVRG